MDGYPRRGLIVGVRAAAVAAKSGTCAQMKFGDNKGPKGPWTEAVFIGVVFAVLWIIGKLLGA